MIADNLKYLRKKNKYTQEELANELNISRQAVSSWENKKAYPDLDNIILLSNLYNISVDILINNVNQFSEDRTFDSVDNSSEGSLNKKNSKLAKVIIILLYVLISFFFPLLDLIIVALNIFHKKRRHEHIKKIFIF